ncbi:hypothetical protein LJC56_11495 [Christensenellaceae bacterium OttesenSCG-928-K19]|nr:hypothetical protein [Christensenellaceae bacterium OttesenSCG-928-K19]
MRINNSTQMNVYNNYTKIGSMLSSTAQKLASAKRINSAADDAAGLAISAKMSAQLRGLNMAARNTQDAVSLVQTSEGAMQETESILQRMNELAVQSSNGILSKSDRAKLSDEFNQLRQEINDISKNTNFNNMNILDGSLSAQGSTRTATTEGIFVNSTMQPAADAASMTQQVSFDASQITNGQQAQFSVDLQSFAIAGAGTGEQFQLAVGDQTLAMDLTAGQSYAAADLAQGIADSLQGQSVQIDGNSYNVGVSGSGVLEFTLDNGGDVANNVAVSQQTMESYAVSASYAAADGASPVSGTASGAVASMPVMVSEGVAHNATGPKITTASFSGRLGVGDVFRMNGKQFELVLPGGTPKNQYASAIGIFEGSSNDQILQAMREASISMFGDTFEISTQGSEIRFEQKVSGEGEMNVSFTSGQQVNTSVQVDPARLRAGDTISLSLTNRQGETITNTYTHMEGNGMDEIAAALTQGASAKVSGNTMLFDNASANLEFNPVQQQGSGIRIQSGPTEGERTAIGIRSLNSADLGIDDLDISTQGGASRAITSIRSALEMVSDQRSTLGATQNRLESKMSNLRQSAENLTAAESRISDADMAEEIINFTKYNIQNKVVTAMQAQANSMMSQNVLSLLR